MSRDLSSSTRSLRLPLVGTLGLALLAVVAVALVFSRSDARHTDRSDRVAAGEEASGRADDPPEQSGTDTDESPDDGPSGFYVPGELPEGWTIRFEEITNPWSEMCPCEQGTWRNGDGAEISAYTSRQQNDLSHLPPDVADETYRSIPGGYLHISGDHAMTADWFDGDVTRGLFAEGLDATTVEALALGWTGDGQFEPPTGFEPVWAGTMPAIERRTEVFWTIADANGRSMIVHLTPWMYDEPADPAAMHPDVEPTVLPGNGLAMVRTPEWTEPHFQGWWPGDAHVTVAGNYGEINQGSPPLTPEEMLDVAGGFSPADAAEWAEYVEAQYDADAMAACRPLLIKPLLGHFLVPPGSTGGDNAPIGDCGSAGE